LSSHCSSMKDSSSNHRIKSGAGAGKILSFLSSSLINPIDELLFAFGTTDDASRRRIRNYPNQGHRH
jgi:hypothetical protein